MMHAVGLFLLGSALTAQEPRAPGPPAPDTVFVELHGLVQTALEQNLRLQAADAATRGAETYRATAWSRFDPTVVIGGEYEGSGIGAQLTGRLPTGATYLLGSVAPSTVAGDPIYADAIVARVDQPVLRGLGLYSDRNAIRAADAGVDAARARLRRTRDQVRAGVRLAYAYLVERHRQEATAARSVERAQELLDAYESLRAIEKITEVDLITARLGVASRQAALLQVQRQRRDAEDVLLFTVYGEEARAVLAGAGDATWMPSDTVIDAPTLPSMADATDRALGARPDLEAARYDAAEAKYWWQHARNAAFPTLNVSASFSSTRNDTLLGPSVGFGERYQEWRFGFVLARPLWNGGASAARSRAAAETDRMAAQLAEAEAIVRQQVRAAIRDIDLAREAVDIAAEASGLARRQYEMERQRLDLGLTDLFRVLQYEEQVGVTERAEAEAWLAYATAVVRYRLAMGED